MATKQEIIDKLTQLYEDQVGLKMCVNVTRDFFELPRSKKEIIEYAQTSLLDVFITPQELKSETFKLLTQSSSINSNNFYSFLTETNKGEEIGKALVRREKMVLSDVVDFLLDVYEEIKESTFQDKIERITALRQAFCKLIILISRVDYHEIPIALTVDQIRDMSTNDGYVDLDYLTPSMNDLANETKVKLRVTEEYIERLDKFKNSIFGYYIDEEMEFLFDTKENYQNILTFMDYVDTFLRY